MTEQQWDILERNQDRYLATCERLKQRYAVDGMLTVSIGGKPTRYQSLCDMAWQRYLADHPSN